VKPCHGFLVLQRAVFAFFYFSALSAVSYSDFNAGAEAFRHHDHRLAAALFERVAKISPSSGALQNLGLAEWENGRPGPAVLAWQQAAMIDPFNHAVAENLAFARKSAQLDAPDFAWHEVVSTWLPASWWAALVAISFWIAVAFLVLPAVFRRPRTAFYQASAAVSLMFFLLCLPAQFGVITRARVGFVLAKDNPLRLTPTQEGQAIVKLSAGEPVRRKRARGHYIFVQSSHGAGWIDRQQIGFLHDAP
jgi:hypothetical protein